ncbi:hypothetical protein [Paenibacillus pinihumi]|uniref:hypothetical protein n=1 Tax=Paenibacillus pinihumi TaxID=669462 RepID=UPI000407B9EB|nr:hypothetical protein [Paenibacillus pinihumi]
MSNDERNFAVCIAQGCAAWRCGDDAEGLGWFQKAALLWLDQLDQAAPDGEELMESQYRQLAFELRQAVSLLEQGDSLLATDRLEAGLLPLLGYSSAGERTERNE